jgi:hypothetical protein
MEEIAYLADLLIASEKPVVFTGAQRHADYPDSDGPRNPECGNSRRRLRSFQRSGGTDRV